MEMSKFWNYCPVKDILEWFATIHAVYMFVLTMAIGTVLHVARYN